MAATEMDSTPMWRLFGMSIPLVDYSDSNQCLPEINCCVTGSVRVISIASIAVECSYYCSFGDEDIALDPVYPFP